MFPLDSLFMLNSSTKESGFTFLEVLLVIAAIGIIAVLGTAFFSSTLGKNELSNVTWDIADNLRKAQSRAMAGRGNDSWSVHFESDKYVIFKGTTYNASDPDNEQTNLSSLILIISISLTGGGSDLIFNKIYGDTDTDGNITVSDNTSDQTRIIDINEVGRINY